MGTNYGRGIIKQVEELTLENERLICANAQLHAQNRELRSQMAELMASTEAAITKLVGEVERLKAQIDKNSGNSSKPPSQDGYKQVKNSREQSGRKSGGQPGHPGKRLELPANLDELVEKGIARREVEDHTGGVASFVSRYTLDVDVTLVVTEHRYLKGSAPLGAEVVCGDKIKALVAVLSIEGLVAQERLSDFFSEITHGAINLSDGTIESFLTEISEKLDAEMEAIKTALLNETVLHVDETPMRCTQRPEDSEREPILREAKGTSFSAYIRTHSSKTATLYTVNPRKDKDSILRDDILPRYVGMISQDHEAKFYNYGTAHATCGAHLLRELLGLFELQKIPWADEMRRFMASMNDHKNADIAAFKIACDPDSLGDFERAYDRLIDSGRTALLTLKKNELGFNELRRMLNRLKEYKDCYLLFIRDYRAPFTNNQAERDLRMCKTKQKVSGCFRSWAGIVRYAIIRSFISTLKKRDLNLFSSVSCILHRLPIIAVGE